MSHSLYSYYKRLPSLLRLSFKLHLFFILILSYSYLPKKSSLKSFKPLKVKTYSISPKKVPAKIALKSRASKTKKKSSPQKTEDRSKKLSHVKTALDSILNQLSLELDTAPSQQTPFSPQSKDLIIAILQSWLTLPEYGEVHLEITFEREGKVSKTHILQSQSDKNSQYILQTLKHAKLPLRLNKNDPLTYTLILSNEALTHVHAPSIH